MTDDELLERLSALQDRVKKFEAAGGNKRPGLQTRMAEKCLYGGNTALAKICVEAGERDILFYEIRDMIDFKNPRYPEAFDALNAGRFDDALALVIS